MKQNSVLQNKVCKIDKTLQSNTVKKKEDDTNIMNGTENITIDSAVIKSILKKYYKQFHTHKFNNLEKTNSSKATKY